MGGLHLGISDLSGRKPAAAPYDFGRHLPLATQLLPPKLGARKTAGSDDLAPCRETAQTSVSAAENSHRIIVVS